MGKKHIFQPDRAGKRTPDSNPGKSLARSHNMAAETAARHGDRPNIARDGGTAKHVHDVKIHGAMVKQTKSGPLAFGGDHASAIDSLTGREVVPGKGGAVATAHPLTTPPKAKPSIGRSVGINPGTIRDRFDDAPNGGSPFTDAAGRKAHAEGRHAMNVEIGRRVLAEAIRTK